jgi:O-antigen ligase
VARLFWFGCALMLAAGVMVTLSRGGFIGLAFAILFLWWKLFTGKRLQGVLVLLLLGLFLIPLVPRTTMGRVLTLATPLADADGSRQQRFDLLEQGLQIAFTPRRLMVGLGFSNYVEVSLRSHKAHNSYIETLAELGVVGFALYMSILIAPMRSLRKVEQSVGRARTESDSPKLRELDLLTKGLQATLVAFMVCSFFLSIQYSWYLYYPVAFAIALQYLWKESGAPGAVKPKADSLQDSETRDWGLLESLSGHPHGMGAQ